MIDDAWLQPLHMKELIRLEANLEESMAQLKHMSDEMDGFAVDFTWHTLRVSLMSTRVLIDSLYDRSNTPAEDA